MERLKICIVCISGLPIPATKGGAIETLIQQIIDRNEIERQFYFTVLTTHDEQAEIKEKEYVYTRFVRMKNKIWSNRVCVRLNRLRNKLFKNSAQYIPLEKIAAVDYLKDHIDEFDLILNETGMEEYILAGNAIPARKKVYHLHGCSEYNLLNAANTTYTIACSNYCAKEWNENGHFNSKNTFVVRNCVDLKKFSKELSLSERENLKRKYGITANTMVLLFAGRLIPEKGVYELIQAVNSLDNENILLLIIGDTFYTKKIHGKNSEYKNKIEKETAKSKSRIEFLGYIANDEMYKYYALADVFCFPSRWEEPAGLVGIEAQAAGCAVICTKSGGIPEFVSESSGILINNYTEAQVIADLRSAIIKLSENRNLCDEMGNAGRRYVKQFDMDAYFTHMCSAIQKIASTKE